MSSPQPVLSKSTPKKAASHLAWLGPCASFLCLIHCFGTGLIALFAPGILEFFPHSLWLESSVLLASGISGFLVFKHQHAPLSLRRLHFLLTLLGTLAWAWHSDFLFHVALVPIALMPSAFLLYRHRNPSHAPECCEHSHDHGTPST